METRVILVVGWRCWIVKNRCLVTLFKVVGNLNLYYSYVHPQWLFSNRYTNTPVTRRIMTIALRNGTINEPTDRRRACGVYHADFCVCLPLWCWHAWLFHSKQFPPYKNVNIFNSITKKKTFQINSKWFWSKKQEKFSLFFVRMITQKFI